MILVVFYLDLIWKNNYPNTHLNNEYLKISSVSQLAVNALKGNLILKN